MENRRHKKNTCEEKNIFTPKITATNAFKICGFHLYKSNFKFKLQQKLYI